MMEEVSERLERAWRLRFDLRIEEAFRAFIEIADSLGLPQGVLSLTSFKPLFATNQDPALLGDTLTLGISLLRARADHAESQRLLNELGLALETKNIPALHHYLFERALQLFLGGDFCKAHELFISAELRANNDFQRFVSLLNSLFCLENLGLAHEHTLQEVERLFRKVKYEPGMKGVGPLLEKFYLSKAFREGRLEAVSPTSKRDRSWTLANYFRLWVSKLPYCRWKAPLTADLEDFVRSPDYLYFKSYRTRTLLGRMHPDDFEPPKWTEWADRVYLWTWNWLVDPEGFPIERVTTLLRVIIDKRELPGLTIEDGCLIQNAVLWLGLFDPNSFQSLPRVVRLFQQKHEVAQPIFELESLVVRFFCAVRDREMVLAKDYLENLKSHPLWRSDQICFKSLVESVQNKSVSPPRHLRILSENLKRVLYQNRNTAEITIDFPHERIIREGAPPKTNESVCRAIELLRRRSCVPLSDFAAAVFGISQFDPAIHSQKVFGILREMRKLFEPYLVFRTKAGFVQSEGDWSHISFVAKSLVTQALITQPEWKTLLYGWSPGVTPQSKANHDCNPLLEKATVTRQEIQLLTGKSRSTANRILLVWERKKWIRREGLARATRYTISPHLRARLKEKELPV